MYIQDRSVYKIGITSDFEKRLDSLSADYKSHKIKVIYLESHSDKYSALAEEVSIKAEFRDHLADIDGTSRTEIFDFDILGIEKLCRYPIVFFN